MLEPARRQAYLDALGIQEWLAREPAAIPATDIPDVEGEPENPSELESLASPALTSPTPPSAPASLEALDWPELKQQVTACTRCALHTSRTQTVFGVGNQQADLLIIGEAPGADEDRQGEPFVGRAGQLLNAMLWAIGLRREQVYIANILKCRPPQNRNPTAEEAVACQGFLDRQIALIQPKLILSVGKISAHSLLKSDAPVSRMRGRVHRYGQAQIPLLVTYHPAYLLRQPAEKAKAWADLQEVARLLGLVGA